LILHLDNTSELYEGQREAFLQNYKRKMQKGVYRRDLALKGIANNLVPTIAKYIREHNPSDASNFRRISMKIKLLSAEEILTSLEVLISSHASLGILIKLIIVNG
jgi:hypothetical protein